MNKFRNNSSIYASLRQVFYRPVYIILALIFAVAILFILNWAANIKLLFIILTSELFNFSDVLKIFISSFGNFFTNFSFAQRTIYLTIALLSGISLSQLIYYFKKRFELRKAAGASFLGIIAGFLGIGCSVCGSLILTSIFGLSATAAVLSFLPLAGLEFGLLSVVLLVWSIFYTAYKFGRPLTCKIKNN